MFTTAEFNAIRSALILSEKSVTRLANKEGQPTDVVAAYLRARGELHAVIRKVESALVEQESKEKLQATAAKKG